MIRKSYEAFYRPYHVRVPMLATPNIEVSYSEILDESCVEFRHRHSGYEIYYCLEGSVTIDVEGRERRFLPGHFLLLRPGVEHAVRYEPRKPARYFVIIFEIGVPDPRPGQRREESEEGFCHAFTKLFARSKCHSGIDRQNAHEVIARLEQECGGREFGWQLLARGHYLELILRVCRNLLPAEADTPEEEHKNIAVEVTRYMHLNYHRNITLDDIADELHVSKRHMARLFENYFGINLKKTLNMFRISYAKNYMLNTDYSAEKIAMLVGYSSPQSLFKQFKENEGITISEFRRRQYPEPVHDERLLG